MERYESLANSVRFETRWFGVRVRHYDPSLTLIGVGRSAAVFRIINSDEVIKVFFPGFEAIALEEAEVYEALHNHPYFPNVYAAKACYLVMEWVPGKTLFDCLVDGTFISREQVAEVDAVLESLRSEGLSPSDVHLKNIMVTPDGAIRLIDVARFRQGMEVDIQWEDLKRAHRLYVKRFFPKRYPAWVLNTCSQLYRRSLLWRRNTGLKQSS